MKPEGSPIQPLKLRQAVEHASRLIEKANLEYYRRIWATDLGIYRARLERIGFSKRSHVLDAGCGFGQWSIGLAELNVSVSAVDASVQRIEVAHEISRQVGLSNISFAQQSLDALSFSDNTFDSVFCYGVLMLTDYRRTLKEITRVLKPGGTLYLTANGLGWYLCCLLDERNASPHYDPRTMAMETIDHSLRFFSTGEHIPGCQLLIPSGILTDSMKKLGYLRIQKEAEGTLSVHESADTQSYYPPDYAGYENVYEVLATKGAR
jgi:SAM-dependent methyltransferase